MTQEDEEGDDYELYFPLRYPRVENDIFDADLVQKEVALGCDSNLLEKIKTGFRHMFKKVIIFEGIRHELFAETEERLIEKEIDFYDKRRRKEKI